MLASLLVGRVASRAHDVTLLVSGTREASKKGTLSQGVLARVKHMAQQDRGFCVGVLFCVFFETPITRVYVAAPILVGFVALYFVSTVRVEVTSTHRRRSSLANHSHKVAN